jgi:hypothetical protein
MSRIPGWAKTIIATIALALGFGAIAIADDRDSREVMSYALTEASLAEFTQATRNLAGIPAACADQDDDSDSQTIDQMAAKLNAVPGAQAAIQSAGMTTREYIVFTFSMLQNGLAAWALTQPGGKLPPGVSQANVNFYNAHAAQMQEISAKDPCDDRSEDEEEPEE